MYNCPESSTVLKADHQIYPNPSGIFSTGTFVGSTLSDSGTSSSPYPITVGSTVAYNGHALQFDGSSNAWVSFGTGVTFGGSDFSISVWGMYTSFGNGWGWSRILDFQPSANSHAGILISSPRTSSQFSARLFNSAEIAPSGTVWTLNQFSHVVFVCTFPNNCKTYFNGVLVSTITLTMSIQTYSYVAGLGKSSYSDDYLHGQVADFRLFFRTLTRGILKCFQFCLNSSVF
jgi:hypothetical protein